jgi:hypothetical protein
MAMTAGGRSVFVRALTCAVAAVLVMAAGGCSLFGFGPPQEIHVSVNGADSNGGGSPARAVKSLAAAVAKVPDGGTIKVAEGIHVVVETANVDKNVTIEGGYKSDFTSVSGLTTFAVRNHTGEILNVQGGGVNRTVVVSNVVFQGAFTAGNGGAVAVYDKSDITFSNCTFTGNSAYWMAGAISVADSSLQCVGCSFDGNNGYYNPSVISLTNSSGAFDTCAFSVNTLRGPGTNRVIAQTTTTAQTASFKDCVFTGNSGRAFYSAGGSLVDLGGNTGMLPPLADALAVYSGWHRA